MTSDISIEAMRVRIVRFLLTTSTHVVASFVLLQFTLPLVPDGDGTALRFFLRSLPFVALGVLAIPFGFLHSEWCFPLRPYAPHLAHELRELAWRTDRFALGVLRDPRPVWRRAVSIRWWCGIRVLWMAP